MDQLKTIYNSFFDVTGAVEGDVARLQRTRDQLAAVELDIATRSGKNEEELKSIRAEVAAKRAAYHAQGKPLMDRASDLSTIGHLYKQMLDGARDAYHYASEILKNESNQYGYLSKQTHSMTQGFVALEAAMRSGKPFYHEYVAFKENVADLEKDLTIWSDIIGHFAFKGLPQHDDAYAAALSLSNVLSEVDLFAAHENSNQSTASSFFSNFMFAKTAESRREPHEDASVIGRRLVNETRAGNLSGAIELADSAAKKFSLQKYNENPLDVVSPLRRPPQGASSSDVNSQDQKPLKRTAPAQAYARFREVATGIIAADQFLMYCDSSLALQQVRMTEPLFNLKD